MSDPPEERDLRRALEEIREERRRSFMAGGSGGDAGDGSAWESLTDRQRERIDAMLTRAEESYPGDVDARYAELVEKYRDADTSGSGVIGDDLTPEQRATLDILSGDAEPPGPTFIGGDGDDRE